MGLLSFLQKIDRKRWFVCSACLMQSGHDEFKSVFYSEEPPVVILGRPWTRCPRCGGTNTRSLKDLENEGCESALWALERLVRKYPRSRFEVVPAETKTNR